MSSPARRHPETWMILRPKSTRSSKPPCLMMVQVLGLLEVHQVFVVSEDLDRKGGSMDVASPGLQGMDNHEEFVVIDVIVLFSWNE